MDMINMVDIWDQIEADMVVTVDMVAQVDEVDLMDKVDRIMIYKGKVES